MGEERKVMYQLGINHTSNKACFMESPTLNICQTIIWGYSFVLGGLSTLNIIKYLL